MELVYFEHNWEIKFTKFEEKVDERSSMISQGREQLRVNIISPQSYTKTVDKDDKYWIASTPNELIILDEQMHQIIFVYNSEFHCFSCDKEPFFGREILHQLRDENRDYLFNISKAGHHQFRVIITVYDAIKSEFVEYSHTFDNEES